MKILNFLCHQKKMLLFLPQKNLRKDGKRQIFPRRDVECTRMRNRKHRGKKTSRSHLINLQRLSEVILPAYILFPSLQTVFKVWWCTKKKGILFQGLLSLGGKHFQFMGLVPLSLIMRKRFYFFPSQGNTSLGIKQWALHLVAFHFVLFLNLCLKVRGTFLGFFCVLKYLLCPLDRLTYPSYLLWIPCFSSDLTSPRAGIKQ